MFSYSIAIRTLGTNPKILRQELESISRQTIEPENVVIYIAEDFSRPDFTIGKEKYVWVKKGMVAQRVLDYKEINSDVILMLDDDVELADDCAERMLNTMKDQGADCVAADTFKNQDLPVKQKIMAFVTNFVCARHDDGWAFRLNRNGSFSYNGNPKNDFCWTETFAGPCWMIKKEILLAVRMKDELWLDRMGFPYGEDAVESYKLYLNGYKSGVLYNSGVKNLDAKTSSGSYHKSEKKFYTRSYGMFVIWWRMIYSSRDKRFLSAFLYLVKAVWLLIVNIVVGFIHGNLKIPYNYMKGIWDGWHYVHSEEYKSIQPYIVKKMS